MQYTESCVRILSVLIISPPLHPSPPPHPHPQSPSITFDVPCNVMHSPKSTRDPVQNKNQNTESTVRINSGTKLISLMQNSAQLSCRLLIH